MSQAENAYALLIQKPQPCAELAASYAKVSRALSLGDRACLALARINHATAWTSDQLWMQLALNVPVELIR